MVWGVFYAPITFTICHTLRLSFKSHFFVFSASPFLVGLIHPINPIERALLNKRLNDPDNVMKKRGLIVQLAFKIQDKIKNYTFVIN